MALDCQLLGRKYLSKFTPFWQWNPGGTAKCFLCHLHFLWDGGRKYNTKSQNISDSTQTLHALKNRGGKPFLLKGFLILESSKFYPIFPSVYLANRNHDRNCKQKRTSVFPPPLTLNQMANSDFFSGFRGVFIISQILYLQIIVVLGFLCRAIIFLPFYVY